MLIAGVDNAVDSAAVGTGSPARQQITNIDHKAVGDSRHRDPAVGRRVQHLESSLIWLLQEQRDRAEVGMCPG